MYSLGFEVRPRPCSASSESWSGGLSSRFEGFGFNILIMRCRVNDSGFRVWGVGGVGIGDWVWGIVFGSRGPGFRVWVYDSSFKFQSVEFSVQGSGLTTALRVESLGLESSKDEAVNCLGCYQKLGRLRRWGVPR